MKLLIIFVSNYSKILDVGHPITLKKHSKVEVHCIYEQLKFHAHSAELSMKKVL